MICHHVRVNYLFLSVDIVQEVMMPLVVIVGM